MTWLSGGLLLFTWYMVIQSYPVLPATIPLHFDMKGQADNWGPKAGIWILPIISSFVFALFTILYRHAHRFPRKPGALNEVEGLALVRMLFLQLRFAVVLVMAAGTYYSLNAAFGKVGAEPSSLVPFIILVMLAPILLFLFRILRLRRGKA